jgi:hypothetical protein
MVVAAASTVQKSAIALDAVTVAVGLVGDNVQRLVV